MVTSSVTAGVPVPVHIPYPVLTYRAMVLGVAGWATMVNASSPRSASRCTAWRTMRRACDRQARLASMRSRTAVY